MFNEEIHLPMVEIRTAMLVDPGVHIDLHRFTISTGW